MRLFTRHIVGVAAAVLMVSACGSAPPVEFVGGPLEDDVIAAGLAAHEAAFLIEASEARWNVADDAACWLPVRDNAGTPSNDATMWCGPALTLESDVSLPWVVYDVAVAVATSPADAGTLAVSGPGRPASGPLVGGLELWRPDGRTAPAVEDIALELPDPPATAPDMVRVSSTPPAPMVFEPVDGLLRVHEAMTVELSGMASAKVMRDANMSAPDGHTLHVWEMRVEPPADLLDPEQVALSVDGRQFPLDLPRDGMVYVTAAAPDGADLALYTRDYSGYEQTMSLTDGTVDGAPDVLYRDNTIVDDLGRYSLPFENPGTFGYGAYPTVLHVLGAELTWTRLTRDGVAEPAGLDRAFLTVRLEQSGGNSWGGPTASVDSWVVVLDDGTEITPLPGLGWSTDVKDLWGGKLLWDVPADVEGLTLRVTPGQARHGGAIFRGRLLDYRDAVAEIRIEFGAP